jgi:DNA repair exonuclease SbcCD nuclease subunit
MIKCFHISDIHLGLTTYGSIDNKTKINSRTVEGFRLFDSVISEAEKNGDVLFISGDIYETPNPSNRIRKEFEQRLVHCNEVGLPVVFIPGNHCIPKTDGSSHPFISDRIYSLPNIFLIDEVGVQTIAVKNGENISVLGLPHLYPKDWKKYGDNSGAAVSNIIKKSKVDKNGIILGHLTVAGIINNYEVSDVFTDEFIVPKEVFQSTDKFAAVLLGHIHQYTKIDNNIWYSGSLFPNTFGEESDRKGYVYFEINNNKIIKQEFVGFNSYTRLKTIKVLLDIEDKQPTDLIVKSIINANVKDCIVRVNYNVTEEQLLYMDITKIREALQDTIFFDITHDIIDMEKDSKNNGIVVTMKPIDIVEKFCLLKGGEYQDNSKDLVNVTKELLNKVEVEREKQLKIME